METTVAITVQVNTDFNKTVTYEELIQMPPGTVAQWAEQIGDKYVHFVVISSLEVLCVYPREINKDSVTEQSVCRFKGSATAGLFKLTGQNVTITIG